MPSDLQTLREVLLAPEHVLLQRIQQRLDDPAIRAAELAQALPAALAIASVDSATLIEHLRPLVREALADALRQQPDLLARGCRHALRHTLGNPLGAVCRGLARLFLPRRRPAACIAEPRIERLYLVRRSDGVLLEHAQRRPADGDDPMHEAFQADQRNVGSMATYLLATLRNADLLSRYALMKTLRIERFVYGFHVTEHHLLLSVMSTAGPLPADLLIRCDQIVADAALADPPHLPAI